MRATCIEAKTVTIVSLTSHKDDSHIFFMCGLYELQVHVLAIHVLAPSPTYLSLGLDTDHLTTLTDYLLHWLVQHVRPTIDSTQPKRERGRRGKRGVGGGREGGEREKRGKKRRKKRGREREKGWLEEKGERRGGGGRRKERRKGGERRGKGREGERRQERDKRKRGRREKGEGGGGC